MTDTMMMKDAVMEAMILPNRTTSTPFPFTVASSTKENQQIIKPGPFDVICARGKQAYNYPGNQYFRSVVAKATAKYSKVESKLQRSMIVTEIVDAIREKGNGFIRQTGQGEWIECSDVMCREKVGQHFRNALGTMYKSSTKSKRRVKEECIPKLAEDLSGLVLSNGAVQSTMERLNMDVIFIEEEDENAFLEKTLIANMKMLNIFKEDESLVQKFQHHYQVGQQALDATYRYNRNRKVPKLNCGNARAA